MLFVVQVISVWVFFVHGIRFEFTFPWFYCFVVSAWNFVRSPSLCRPLIPLEYCKCATIEALMSLNRKCAEHYHFVKCLMYFLIYYFSLVFPLSPIEREREPLELNYQFTLLTNKQKKHNENWIFFPSNHPTTHRMNFPSLVRWYDEKNWLRIFRSAFRYY